MVTVSRTTTEGTETVAKPIRQKKDKPAPPPPREVVYKEVEWALCRGENALTVQQAKDLLGWSESGDGACDLTDMEGKKIWLLNNGGNRILKIPETMALVQDHLRRRWRFNGESLIIGKTKLTLSCQKRLVSLIFAGQLWAGHGNLVRGAGSKPDWKEIYGPDEPTMECCIVYGIDEDPETVRTLDNTQSRDESDIIYTCGVFGKLSASKAAKLSRITGYAVRQLWHRTGAKVDPFSPYLTRSELIEYLGHHPHLLQAVNHITEEDQQRSIGRYMSPGYASAFLYLMGTSASDVDAYRGADVDVPCEDQLDFTNWDKACEFWVMLSSASPLFAPVRRAIVGTADSPKTSSMAEKTAILVKAWGHFLAGDTITEKDLRLEYVEKDGVFKLAEHPTCGGIDMEREVIEAKEEEAEPSAPTEEEIAAQAAQIRTEREAKKTATRPKPPSPTVAEPGSGEKGEPGKPPAPKLRKASQADINAQQTAKARAADEQLAKERNGPALKPAVRKVARK